MKKIAIIGTGSWAKRLQKIFCYEDITLIDPREEYNTIGSYDEIWYCVPGHALEKVFKLNKFKSIGKPTKLVSCIKGLTESGKTPMQFLHENTNVNSEDIKFLGGPCIDNGKEIVQFGGKDLEFASILKNIYAIGFGMEYAKNGINYASGMLKEYIREMEENNIGYFDDLLATCISSKSRNTTFGKSLMGGVMLSKEITVEGFNSAKIILENNLFPGYGHLRGIIDDIFINYKKVYGKD